MGGRGADTVARSSGVVSFSVVETQKPNGGSRGLLRNSDQRWEVGNGLRMLFNNAVDVDPCRASLLRCCC